MMSLANGWALVGGGLFLALATNSASLAQESARGLNACLRAEAKVAVPVCTRALAGLSQEASVDRARALNARGLGYLQLADLEKAESDFEAASQLDPVSPHPVNNRGRVFLEREDFNRAFGDFEAALRRDPTYHFALSNRGLVHAARDQHDKAIADFDAAIRLKPDYANTFRHRGASFRATGDFDRAIKDFNEALRLRPAYFSALLARGSAMRDSGQIDRAIADLTAAIALEPKSTRALIARGYAHRLQKRYDLALSDYTSAAALDPTSSDAFTGIALIHRARGDTDRALKEHDHAVRLGPRSAVTLNGRGLTLMSRGELERAQADFDAALKVSPSYRFALINRGIVRQRLGDWTGAITDFSALIALSPEHSAAYTNRGLAFEKIGDPAKARKDYEAVLARPPLYEGGEWAKEAARKRLAQLGHAKPPEPQIRVILLIANSIYGNQPSLKNPAHDVRVLSSAFARLGFKVVIVRENLSRAAMDAALTEFAELARSADWAAVYFAGHGVAAEGQNFLLPVDAKLRRQADIKKEGIALDQVQRAIAGAKALRLVIVDACRDNPFLGDDRKGGRGRALAPNTAPGLTFVGEDSLRLGDAVFFAAKVNQKALDGDGENSPFVLALAKHLETPGMELNRLFRAVTVEVLAATGERQRPFAYESLPNEDFLLKVTQAE